MNPNQGILFEKDNTARYGDNHRHQNLFLPKLLEQVSGNELLKGEAQENAYKIICKWADLEAGGKLQNKNETTLEGEFITEVFGQALGYTLFSKNAEYWNIVPKFSINGGQADVALGIFSSNQKQLYAVIELKGPNVNLDRDRFNGRTAVKQCWEYLNALPECQWGIVCNYVSFRIYHSKHGNRNYQLFTLQDLRRREIFQQFYYIFHRDGILPDARGRRPRADELLERTINRQLEVGDELYKIYDRNRGELILYLSDKKGKMPRDKAIRVVQKLIDRIIFVAFCEDRELLPKNSLARAYSEFSPFEQVTNPQWQNFLKLFSNVDKGNPRLNIPAYNGGLFAEDPDIDNLDLDDEKTEFFRKIGEYDFSDEVNVEVLGHLFEKSVKDIERIRRGGLFDAEYESGEPPKMDKSAERKRFGIYYTPPEFTSFITKNTIGELIDQRLDALAQKHQIAREEKGVDAPDPKRAAFWRESLEALRQIKIIDPACGSGAFLISAYEILADKYSEIVNHLIYHDQTPESFLAEQTPSFILNDNIFGVDLSEEAVEITKLALWIRSAVKGKTLADLSQNIICGNSLVSDPEIDPLAFDWKEKFPQIFNRDNRGFDCVIGNPPWERLKLQEREFFDGAAADIATAVSAATRRKLIDKIKKSNPELYARYNEAQDKAEKILSNVRNSGRFPLAGKGDINTYAVFAELASTIIAPHGRVGLLVPTGIATDDTTKEFFAHLVKEKSLIGLYDFENREKIFPDVDGRFKFSIFLFGGSAVKAKSADFAFYSHRMEDLNDKNRRIALTPSDLHLLNPNTNTCPVFRTRRDAELTKAIYKRVPILVDCNRKDGGNPWAIKFLRMFDQTNDAELFHTAEQLKKDGLKLDGNIWKKGKKKFLPLYEAKMIQMYDHRAASIVVKKENWMRQGQTAELSPVEHQNPELSAMPRWWVDEEAVINRIGQKMIEGIIGFKDITSPTNQRTMIASAVIWSAMTNHFPLIVSDQIAKMKCCLLANLNTFILDYVCRQKIGGITLNFFIVEQLPVIPPDTYSDRCPWDKRQTLEKWISDRVLKLTCTSNDMIPLAKAAGFEELVHKWKPDDRADLMAQLDAAYFILYGIERDDIEYILSTFQGLKKKDEGMFEGGGASQRILKHYDHFKGLMTK